MNKGDRQLFTVPQVLLVVFISLLVGICLLWGYGALGIGSTGDEGASSRIGNAAVLPVIPTVLADTPAATLAPPASMETPEAPSKYEYAGCLADTYTLVSTLIDGPGQVTLADRTESLRGFFSHEVAATYTWGYCQAPEDQTPSRNALKCLADETAGFARRYWDMDNGRTAKALGGRYALTVCQPSLPE